MRSKRYILTIIILTLMLISACAPAPTGTEAPANGLRILASTTFLADIAQNVAGQRAQVQSLLPIGADPHAFQPAPADVARVTESDVLILNGAEYEHFIEPVLENAGGQRLVITASDGLTALTSTDSEHALDPHFWLDPNNVITYVENIRNGLSQADPKGATDYASNAEAYIARLKDLDGYILAQVALIPADQRLLLTNHGSLAYFAERYGFTIVGTIIPGSSSEAGASAQQIAAVIDTIKSSGVKAIFLDTVENPNFAEQLAQDTGVKVVNGLHLESLTASDGTAPTYIDMMKHNVDLIVGALKP